MFAQVASAQAGITGKQEARIRVLAEAMTRDMDEGLHAEEIAPIEEALLASMKLIEGYACQ
jgi:hypothetical protein